VGDPLDHVGHQVGVGDGDRVGGRDLGGVGVGALGHEALHGGGDVEVTGGDDVPAGLGLPGRGGGLLRQSGLGEWAAARRPSGRRISYRSAIFYLDDEQRRVAEDTIADVDASGLWPGPVVTEVVPAGPFWEAEPEHQDYLQRYPDGYTCHFPRPNWRLPKRGES
jgi:hypothetical protein